MMFFPRRDNSKEIMDDHSITGPEMYKALDELEVINKYLGGRAVTREGIEYCLKAAGGKKSFTLLDLGSGGSDVLRFNGGAKIKVFHLDVNPGILKRMKSLNSDADCICADAAALCFKEKSFDLIHLSLFLHHFSNDELKSLLTEAMKTARIGIVINDLRRNILAYAGIKLLVNLFSKSKMVKNDGPLSVKRSFVRQDLTDMLNPFGKDYIIKRKWAFRWLVCICPPPGH